MKKKLFCKDNFISRRGSATMMALIFLLFFVIIGAGWAAMMNKEAETSAADKYAQQAWYAAEAGVKRTQEELLNKNQKWDWVSQDGSTPAYVDVTTGTAPDAANKLNPRYSVSVYYVENNEKKYLSETNPMSLTTTRDYIITSQGSIIADGDTKGSRTITKKFTITVQ